MMKVEPVMHDDNGPYVFLIQGETFQGQPTQIALSLREIRELGDMVRTLHPIPRADYTVATVVQAVTDAHKYGGRYIGPMWLALTISAMLMSQGGMGFESLKDVVSGDYLAEIEDWEARLAGILQEMNPVIEELKILEGVEADDL